MAERRVMCSTGLQASVLEMLADLLDSPAGSAIAREGDEDLPAMRAEAARKLEELVEVRRHACCALALQKKDIG